MEGAAGKPPPSADSDTLLAALWVSIRNHWVALVVVALLMCCLTVLILPAISYCGPEVRVAECRNNLRQIGIAMHVYADDFNGAFPENLQQLSRGGYADNIKLFSCPAKPSSCKDFRPGGRVTEKSSSYAYVPGLTSSMPGNFILAYDKSPGNHREWGLKGGRSVLLVDITVEWCPASREAEFQKRLAEQPALVESWRQAQKDKEAKPATPSPASQSSLETKP